MSGPTWLAIVAVCSASVVTGLPDVSDDTEISEFALNWLQSYGYLRTPEDHNVLTVADISSAIRRMQDFAHLPETGEIDAETVRVMKMPRCSMPDFEFDDISKNYQWPRTETKWNKYTLTYRMVNFGRDMSRATVMSSLRTAFTKWSDVCGISFVNTYGYGDISLGFYTYSHGDNSPFDGPSGVLAHAFFPPNGRIHFDQSETFGTYGRGIDFLWVAVHEIGHSIGLRHSNNRRAVMWPVYEGYIYNLKLHYDDISRALYLYPLRK